MVRCLGSILCLLLASCAGPAPKPTAAPPPAMLGAQPSGPTATLTYTATGLELGYRGTANGRSALHLYATPEFCAPVKDKVGGLREVSAARQEITVTIPAARPLVVEAFWSRSDQHCLLGNRAFMARPGIHYRMTTRVDQDTGCVLWVQKRDGGDLVDLGQLQTLDQICAN